MAKVVDIVIGASNDEDGVANAMYWYVLWGMSFSSSMKILTKLNR